jgi:RNA polymerase sigma factor (sigma-70 family)
MSFSPLPIATDEELISHILSSAPPDRELAWRFIYKEYFPVIQRLIRQNRGSADDSRDIFHEGLAILHNNIHEGRFKQKSAIRTYLYSICRNLWLKELRKRNVQLPSIDEMVEDLKQDVNTYLIDVEVVSLLMNELSEDCRRILVEYYFNLRTMEQLKDIFNVNSVQAAKNKKWRCLNYLKRLFESKSIIPFRTTDD